MHMDAHGCTILSTLVLSDIESEGTSENGEIET